MGGMGGGESDEEEGEESHAEPNLPAEKSEWN
jgi:hypothetical protein